MDFEQYHWGLKMGMNYAKYKFSKTENLYL